MFSPIKTTKNIFEFGTKGASYIGIRKRECKMMNKTRQNAIKRIQNERNRKLAYDMTIQFKDMVKNDENVKKFFESLKKG